MKFVIMNVNTEDCYRRSGESCRINNYSTKSAAKGVCTKLNKTCDEWVVVTLQEFNDKHNPMVAVYNSITGDGVTPVYIRRSEIGGCCDPSTELYHTM